MVEHRSPKPRAGGSSPSASAMSFILRLSYNSLPQPDSDHEPPKPKMAELQGNSAWFESLRLCYVLARSLSNISINNSGSEELQFQKWLNCQWRFSMARAANPQPRLTSLLSRIICLILDRQPETLTCRLLSLDKISYVRPSWAVRAVIQKQEQTPPWQRAKSNRTNQRRRRANRT